MSLSNMDTNAKALNDLLTKAVQENKRNYADQWAKLAKFPTQYIGIQFTDWDVEDIRRMVQWSLLKMRMVIRMVLKIIKRCL